MCEAKCILGYAELHVRGLSEQNLLQGALRCRLGCPRSCNCDEEHAEHRQHRQDSRVYYSPAQH